MRSDTGAALANHESIHSHGHANQVDWQPVILAWAPPKLRAWSLRPVLSETLLDFRMPTVRRLVIAFEYRHAKPIAFYATGMLELWTED